MAFEPFMQILRGLQGKRTNIGLGDIRNTQQMAFLRHLQKEMNQEDALNIPLHELNVVVFDIETTGFSPEKGDGILSIGATKMYGTTILEEDNFYSLVRYEKEIPEHIVQLTGITNEQVLEAKPLADVFIKFLEYKQDCTLVAHHATHERNFLQSASSLLFRTPFKHRIVDTSFLFKIIEPKMNMTTLEELCSHNNIPVVGRHHALGDAKMTAKLWSIYLEKAQLIGCETLHDVYNRFARM
ncbi:exonuclease domain-containing protein [Psychrobacillus sp. FJAT-21963]|uniref:exonuclease domain-containing protein n=1 Tax=Psychrobacillus sp. FJAT-21963 TaxID=1712028 RepID=UPI0007023195|nr:exonuclease domain-containing protein [Psychrobacillus sp. FJAT-21963]KQL36510.1 exonuclease [Psychrobacillus sp. FJAT-21963]